MENFKLELPKQLDKTNLDNLDAQEHFTKINNIMQYCLEKHIPRKEAPKQYVNNLPWLTAGMKRAITTKNRLYTIYHKKTIDITKKDTNSTKTNWHIF